jgi:D-alanyl-lipoteichoic acid acyltransferase DltB (MBOAT superfamily)
VAAGKGASRKALATPAGFANLIALPMIVTMTLAGIWHGAGPQYLVFGLLHGFYLTVNQDWRTFGPKLPPVAGLWKRSSAHIAGVALTFLAVIVAQVFFRADSVSDATALLSGMFGLNGFAVPAGLSFSALSLEQPLLILAMLAIIWTMPNTQKIMSAYSTWHFPGPLRAVAYSIVAYMILFGAFRPQSFIYFQF